jgi:diguanylate cyclase (GGDEF)-like protein/PAS domain S-box-containing protein
VTEVGGSRPDGLDHASAPPDLVTSEARFRVLFEHAADVGFVTDAAGFITYVTPSVTDAFGFAPHDLIGMAGRALYEPDSLAELDEVVDQLAERGKKVTFTSRMRAKDGSLRWVDVSMQNMIESPMVGGYVANVRDVTAQLETLRALRAARAQQRAILDRSHDLTMFFEPDGTIAWASPNCVKLFGLGPQDLIGRNGMDAVHVDDRDRVIREFLGMQTMGDSVRTQFRVTDAHGRLRWVEEIATNLIDEPDVGYVVGNLRDVTDEHVAIHALAASEARHRSIVDTAQEGIWVTNAAGRTVFANPRMAEILGTTTAKLEAGSLVDFMESEERALVRANDGMSGRGEIRRYETRFLGPDGVARWALVSSSPLPQSEGDDGEPTIDILRMVTDITDRKRDEAELRRITLHDGLTGLPNRRLLTDRLVHHLESAGRQPTAVLFLNLDNFKDVNDSLGHAAGDVVISEIARRLRRAARTQDTVARSGGDEFLVLCEEVTDLDEAVAIAERMRVSLHAPFRIDSTELVVTASVGIALNPPADAKELIRGAGIAMYRAKRDGRDGIAVFDQHNEAEAQERVRTQMELRSAIANNEFEVWYQPIVGLDDAAVRGVEALVRWRHPTRGLLLPGAFMAIAESTGLIRDIGRDVLETACRDAVDWMDRDAPVRVSVNIAGLQVVDDRFCAQVAEILQRTRMDPEMLTLEVTESSAMRDEQAAERNLHGLRALGVRLALDDFGTGYSSLSFLKRLPVTVVKIDQSFVAGVGERREDELIVSGVISMAHALGHTVIAEGIETPQQRDALRRLGCRYGQGFLWSRAVPRRQLAAVIDTIESERATYLDAASEESEARLLALGPDAEAAVDVKDATLLDNCLDQMRDDALRHGTTLTVFCCDLMGLDDIASAQGGAATAQLLAQAAGRLARVLRDGDIVGRTRDDQFVVACAALDAPGPDAERIAGRIEAVVGMPFQLGSRRVSIGVRVGYVTDNGRRTSATLLRVASTVN